ncbi:MAG: DUF302 domain-containing protein [Coriobacteriia bacterium]|nr:DUF302 domain-containing protein [Coriobacteriia bacterium]
MNFTYKRVGTKDFNETVEAVERTARSHGFVLRRVHDLKATLAAKGFQIQQLTILEVVVGPEAERQVDCEQGLVSVCRLHVYIEDDVVYVTAIRPTMMSKVFPDSAAQEEAAALEESVVRLVDEVVGV